jgi:hypothetical protein
MSETIANNNNETIPMSFEEKLNKAKAEYMITLDKIDNKFETVVSKDDSILMKLNANPKFKNILTMFSDEKETEYDIEKRDYQGLFKINTFDLVPTNQVFFNKLNLSSLVRTKEITKPANCNVLEKINKMKSNINYSSNKLPTYYEAKPYRKVNDYEIRQIKPQLSNGKSNSLSIKEDFAATLERFHKINKKSSSPLRHYSCLKPSKPTTSIINYNSKCL